MSRNASRVRGARARMHRLCVFMTPADEEAFGREVLAALPAVRFVDLTQQTTTPVPELRQSLGECQGRLVTLVDTSILSEGAFASDCVVPHPSGQGWVYGMVGRGLASLVRPVLVEAGLANGELRATVPPGDAQTARFVDVLMGATSAGGTGVHAVDPETATVGRRAERGLVAWPDAAHRFDGAEGARLVNGPDDWYVARR